MKRILLFFSLIVLSLSLKLKTKSCCGNGKCTCVTGSDTFIDLVKAMKYVLDTVDFSEKPCEGKAQQQKEIEEPKMEGGDEIDQAPEEEPTQPQEEIKTEEEETPQTQEEETPQTQEEEIAQTQEEETPQTQEEETPQTQPEEETPKTQEEETPQTQPEEETPQTQPEEEKEAEKCPDAPLKEGTYTIQADGNNWEYVENKIVLNQASEQDTQKFEFTLTEDCKYLIKSDGKNIGPSNACQTIEIIKETPKTPFDVLFLIDATNSMGKTLTAVQKYTVEISETLGKDLNNYDIKYGIVYYQDSYMKRGKESGLDFTNDMEKFQAFVNKQKILQEGSNGQCEDMASGYALADTFSWRDGMHLIIQIGDACTHGAKFSGGEEKDYKRLYGFNVETEDKKMNELTLKFCDKPNTFIKAFKVINPWSNPEDTFKVMNEVCAKHRKETGSTITTPMIEWKDFDENNNDPSYFTGLIVSSTKEAEKEYKKLCKPTLAPIGTEENPGDAWTITGEEGSYTITLGDKVAQYEDPVEAGTSTVFVEEAGENKAVFGITPVA